MERETISAIVVLIIAVGYLVEKTSIAYEVSTFLESHPRAKDALVVIGLLLALLLVLTSPRESIDERNHPYWGTRPWE